MKRLACITALCIASVLPTFTAAAERNDLTRALRGDYAVSGDGACLDSKNGFDPVTFRALASPGAPGLIRSHSVYAVRKFNGDGTGTVKGRSIVIGHNSTATTVTNLGPYFTENFSADFTYTVASDRSIHIANGPMTFTQTEGPSVGQTDVWTGVLIDGQISQDFKTIVVATPGAVLETRYDNLANALSGANPTHYRHCHRSRTLIRISDGDVERERGNSRFPF